METNHSAGPWRACHDGTCMCGQVWSTAEGSCVAIALDSTTNEYGEACRVAPKSEELYANMRLIAAAPELLETVQNLVGMFDVPAFRRRQAPMQREALEIAHKIINKAITGKEG